MKIATHENVLTEKHIHCQMIYSSTNTPTTAGSIHFTLTHEVPWMSKLQKYWTTCCDKTLILLPKSPKSHALHLAVICQKIEIQM
jgi:hypothetical protein